MSGKLLIFSGPSGSGKTTVVHHLLDVISDLGFSVSATTRKKRHNEKDGVDYYFLSEENFLKKIDENDFVEWEQVYKGGAYYGTLKSEVDRILASGKHVIFDVDVVGGLNIKKHYGKRAMAVIVVPHSIEQLKDRLKKRATETEESFLKRIHKSEEELGYQNRFDKILLNDDKATALKEAEKMATGFLKQ